MITRKTVFLLGAGANVPYGFSTGAKLLDKAKGRTVERILGNAARTITNSDQVNFASALNDNMLSSIDALLEHRIDLWAVGKRVMAALLYEEEKGAKPPESAHDWMSLVFEKMAAGARTLEEFSKNNVEFITFNYDRYLEHRFIRGLVARYNVAPDQAWSGISQMKFSHLHGSLGPLPEQCTDKLGENRILKVPLGAPDTDGQYTLGLVMQYIEHWIRIVHDPDVPSNFSDEAESLKHAEQIFVCGFGFGGDNVRRLRLTEVPTTTAVYCTAYGMTQAEIVEYIEAAFPNHSLRNGAKTGTGPIREFLRELIQTLR